MSRVERLARRWPVLWCVALTGVLIGLSAVSRDLLPSYVVGDVSELDPAALRPPTPLEQAVAALRTSDNLFWLLAILLALALIPALSSYEEAGLTRMGRRLYLALFPLGVASVYLSGGAYVPGAAVFAAILAGLFMTTFGEEVVYRGLMWSVLAPGGVVRAVVLTALLSGALYFVLGITTGPWPEAVFVSLLAVGGGFAFGALRWRTASLWPAVAAHLVLAVARDVAAPGERVYQILLLLSTVGFVLYGLFLLRSRRAREDGG